MKMYCARLPASVVVVVLLLTVLVITAAVPSRAMMIKVKPREMFTFTEEVPPGNVVLFAYQMNPDFVFSVRIRDKMTRELVKEWEKNARGYVNIPASKKFSELTFEFDNSDSMLTGAKVNFDIRVLPDPNYNLHTGDIDPIEKRIGALHHKMRNLRTSLEELRYWQKSHRDTVEDANGRLLLWSVVQLVSFFVAAGGQLWLLRRFLEKRRTV